jgi:hypothetical protein
MNKINIESNHDRKSEPEVNHDGRSTKGESFYFGEVSNDLNSTRDGNKHFEETDKKYTTKRALDIKRNRFPFCIVWTPLPLISWFLPIIGHTGICTYIILFSSI